MILHVEFTHNVSLALDGEEWGPQTERNTTIVTTYIFLSLRSKTEKKKGRIGREAMRRFFSLGQRRH